MTLRYHFSPVRWTKIHTIDNILPWQDCVRNIYILLVNRNEKWYRALGGDRGDTELYTRFKIWLNSTSRNLPQRHWQNKRTSLSSAITISSSRSVQTTQTSTSPAKEHTNVVHPHNGPHHSVVESRARSLRTAQDRSPVPTAEWKTE